MKKQLNQIREFFWPLLETLPEEDIAPQITILELEDDNIETAYDIQNKIVENEEDRRKGIESKAALFLSSISIATSVIVAGTSLISGSNQINNASRTLISISFILSIYALRTVWFAIKVLERKSFYVIDYNDINAKGSQNEYKKSLIKKMSEYAILNQNTINEKIDYFTMSQEYYKRAVVVIFMYSLVVCIFSFFPFKEEKSQTYTLHKIANSKVNYKPIDTVKHTK